MRRSWMPLLLMIALAVLVLATVACADETDQGGSGSTTTSTPSGSQTTTTGGGTPGEPSQETPVAPGLHEREDGTVQAVGILDYRDLEGGFWAVVDTSDPAQADDADVVAVLGSSDEIPGPIKSYEGKYVSVIGLQRDVSVYQAGPFVEVQSIKVVSDTVAK